MLQASVNLVLKRELLVDNLSKEKRSRVMTSIRGKNTKPEIAIRKLLWRKGIRYRIHNKSIFGTPDISIKKDKVAIFIDGCFWHACKKCYKEPTTNPKFWREKINGNKKRRVKVISVLKKDGWKILQIWEHDVKSDALSVVRKIEDKL